MNIKQYFEVHRSETTGQCPVILYKHRSKIFFAISYGREYKENLSYEESCKEYGRAVFHMLNCNGLMG